MKCKKGYKDIEKYKAYRRRSFKKYYDKTATYEPVTWTQEQEELVLKHEMTDTQLSGLIGHSVKAIQIKRCRLKKLLSIIPLFLLLSMPVHATPLQADNYPEIEPLLIRCTCYTAEEGEITADGSKVREGIVAGKKEWLGYTCIIYENDNGKIGNLIGIYEFKDTGAGIDTDGDGKGDSIKKGTSIDVYRDSLEGCYDWIESYGDFVYIQVIYGVG